MKVFIKKLLLHILRVLNLSMGERASILMYHSVGFNPIFFTVKPDVFRDQMRYLVTHDYHIISLSELVTRMEKRQSIARCVVITLDDGYVDNFENAFLILNEFSIPATLFVPTGLIGSEYKNIGDMPLPLANETLLKSLGGRGLIEIMPHSVTHPSLDRVSRDVALKEIKDSKKYLEERFGIRADIFAYPKGRFTEELFPLLQHNGYRAAVTVRPGLVTLKSNPFALPRNSIDSTTTHDAFRVKISGGANVFETLKFFARKIVR